MNRIEIRKPHHAYMVPFGGAPLLDLRLSIRAAAYNVWITTLREI